MQLRMNDEKIKRRRMVSAGVTALVYSIILILYRRLVLSQCTNQMILLIFLVLCFFVGLYVLFGALDFLTANRCRKTGVKPLTNVFCITFLAMWLPWFVLCFPGNMAWDTGSSIIYALGIDRINVNNPVFQNYLFGAIYRFGVMINNVDAAVVLYTALQIAVYVACFASVLDQLRKWSAPNGIVVFLLLFYGLCPFIPIYALTVGKDSNFAIVVFAFSFLLLKLVVEKEEFLQDRKKYLCLILTGALLGLLRNHGVSIPIICLGGVTVVFYRHSRKLPKKLLYAILTVIIINAIIPVCMSAPKGDIAESLSIPIQQTAYYFNNYSDEITEEESRAISGVLPIEALKEYNPEISDPVKQSFKNNASDEELRDYFRVWLSQLKKHPGAYLRAVYNLNYVYYTPHAIGTVKPQRPWGYDISRNVFEMTEIRKPKSELLKYAKLIDQFVTDLPVIGLFQKIGIYSWILIMFCIYHFTKKDCRVICLLPSLIILLACCCSPVNGYFRYALSMIVTVPMSVTATIYAEHNTKRKGNRNGW